MIYATNFLDYLWIIWLVSILFSIEYLRSIFKYRHPQIGDFRHHSVFVIFQITTKGNEACVEYTIRKVRMACKAAAFDNYRIDVVTDSQNDFFTDVNMIHVPDAYQAPNRCRYKARALQ